MQRAESDKQRAERNEQKVENKEHYAKTNKQGATRKLSLLSLFIDLAGLQD